jgi:hypothetical protein
MKERRKQQILKRRNFLPTLLVTILLWLVLSGLIYFIDPGTFGAVPLFFVLLFVTFLFTFSLLFASTRRGLITSLSLSLFAILAYLGVGNVINLLLIAAIAICVELYLSKR